MNDFEGTMEGGMNAARYRGTATETGLKEESQLRGNGFVASVKDFGRRERIPEGNLRKDVRRRLRRNKMKIEQRVP